MRICAEQCAPAYVVMQTNLQTAVFGILPDGRRVDAITLANPSGLQVHFFANISQLDGSLVTSRCAGDHGYLRGYNNIRQGP